MRKLSTLMVFMAIFVIPLFSICACSMNSPDAPFINEPDNVLDDAATDVPLAAMEPETACTQAVVEEEYPSEEQAEETVVSSQFLFDIMNAKREIFGKILDDPINYEVQILLTEIGRDKTGQPYFLGFEYGLDAKKYFYPASAVKMAIAALTLQKINSLQNANRECALNVAASKNGAVGRRGLTIETYIKRMIIYSDNISYNRLYDFLGQEYINESLHAMGYKDVQIVRRFDSPTSAAGDRVNYACELRDGGGDLIYSQPSLTNENIYTLRERDDMTGLLRGKAQMTSKGRIAAPKEFYDYNYMSLEVMQQILKALVFPQYVEETARFNILEDDREFLLNCMLGESTQHKYFLYGGTGRGYDYLEIYNKTGTSYGNIIDNAYIRDTMNNIEFMLTAVIYVNPNGVIGDDAYDYERTGIPFLQELGLAVYNHYLEKKYSRSKRW